jgi:hypothetical protein
MARRQIPALFEQAQARFRTARFRQVQAMIDQLVAQYGTIRVLDAGGRAEYWNMLSPAAAGRVHVTIINTSPELADYSTQTAEHVA